MNRLICYSQFNQFYLSSRQFIFAVEGGEILKQVIAQKEKEVQEKEAKNEPKDGEQQKDGAEVKVKDIVREEEVADMVKHLEAKIANSPVSPEYKVQIQIKLDTIKDEGVKAINAVKEIEKAKLVSLVEDIKMNILKFETDPTTGVKELLDMSEKKDAVTAVIRAHVKYNLGDWRKINKEFNAALGYPENDDSHIKLVQRNLKTDSDGQIGPKTLAVIGMYYGTASEPKIVKPIDNSVPVAVGGSSEASPPQPVEFTPIPTPTAQEQAAGMSVAPVAPEGTLSSVPVNPSVVDLAREQKLGFARLYGEGETQKMLDQFDQSQKLDMLKALQEPLSEKQKLQLQQIDMVRLVIDSVQSNVRDSRTKTEWLKQAFTEGDDETGGQVKALELISTSLSAASEKIKKNPELKLTDLIGGAQTILDGAGLGSIVKEATSQEDVKAKYIQVFAFLRDNKDYSSAQTLVEETLLAKEFEDHRNLFPDSRKQEIREAAREKVHQRVTKDIRDQWRKGGMTDDQMDQMEKAMIDEDAQRSMNKAISEYNKGIPFTELKGKDMEIMKMYKDMMGTGEWHNFSDESWDTIMDEVLINAPLIVVSGGVASAARAGLSAGARTLMATGRFARLGLAATEGVNSITATGRIGKSLYQAGRLGGLIVEGATFETVHSGLQGEWIGHQPDWVKRILWSSVTLGAFHGAGKVSEKVISKMTKYADKSLAQGIQKLAVSGSIETATMLSVGVLQRAVETGELRGPELDEVLHALLAVGALKISGKVVEVGSKSFKPKIKENKNDLPLSEAPVDGKLLGLDMSSAKALENSSGEIVLAKDGNLAKDQPSVKEASSPETSPLAVLERIVVDKNQAAAEKADSAKEAGPNRYERLKEYLKSKLEAIKDLNLRAKVKDILGNVIKFSRDKAGAGWKKTMESWNSIRQSVAAVNKRFAEFVDTIFASKKNETPEEVAQKINEQAQSETNKDNAKDDKSDNKKQEKAKDRTDLEKQTDNLFDSDGRLKSLKEISSLSVKELKDVDLESKSLTREQQVDMARKLLNLPKNFTEKNLKLAFRKVAFEYHPDRAPSEINQHAEGIFKILSRANLILVNYLASPVSQYQKAA